MQTPEVPASDQGQRDARHRETVRAMCLQAAATVLAGRAAEPDEVMKTAESLYRWVTSD